MARLWLKGKVGIEGQGHKSKFKVKCSQYQKKFTRYRSKVKKPGAGPGHKVKSRKIQIFSLLSEKVIQSQGNEGQGQILGQCHKT